MRQNRNRRHPQSYMKSSVSFPQIVVAQAWVQPDEIGSAHIEGGVESLQHHRIRSLHCALH